MENKNSDHIKLTMIQQTNLSVTHKKKKNSILKSITRCFKEFSRNTSIHGFKYLGRTRGCNIEKIWWLTILTLCIYMCTILTIMTLKKREENPVFVSFRQQPMHIWDVPFPAITVCPISSTKNPRLNFSQFWDKYSKNLTDGKMKLFMDANIKDGQAKDMNMFPYKHDEFLINFFIVNSLSIDDILGFCIFFKNHRSCAHLFSPIMSVSGLCYSLNMLDSSELMQNITVVPENHLKHPKSVNWNPDTNYNKTLEDTNPVRIVSQNDGLFFQLKVADSYMDEICRKCIGFRLILHHPADLPISSNRYSILSANNNYKILIIPDIITTSANLQDYSPRKRGCFFSHERGLKFFKIYTEENCRIECISNFTKRICRCTPHFIPHEENTRICGLSDISCIFRAKDEFLNLEMEIDVLENATKHSTSQTCDCLPSCTAISYNAKVIPEQIWISAHNGTSYTTVFIGFKDSNFLTMERNELFSNADFWASCGGLLGLFTGFSVVSLAEIIYFSTVNWICRICKIRRA